MTAKNCVNRFSLPSGALTFYLNEQFNEIVLSVVSSVLSLIIKIFISLSPTHVTKNIVSYSDCKCPYAHTLLASVLGGSCLFILI